MKRFFVLIVVIIALCISNFAQKKATADPCLSKDPKVRATSKKPCSSAPTPKKTKPTETPKETDDKDSSDESDEDGADSPSDGKTPRKPKPSTSSKNKSGAIDDTMFFITVEHNGEKTELKYTQFENHGGNATLEDGKGRMNFFYGAGNSVKNDEDFEFIGMISAAAKGTYQIGTPGTMFGFKADKFPNVPVFLCKSGVYEIKSMPLTGGFVEGTFSAACENVTNDGEVENYNLSGSFKLLRMY